jgi:NADH dehydrogenase FAD-containing subunit
MKTVVVLGGSFAGVSTAHRILKKNPDVKITLVSPDTHIFWNLAGPRGIIPGGFADDKLFAPFAPGFKQYGDRYEFVLGTAESLDIQSKKVVVATPAGESVVLEYDAVILATGSRTAGDVPYKSKGSYEKTRDVLHEFQEKVKNAKSIVVGGAGSTGVETAGELGYEYGSTKKITLVSLALCLCSNSELEFDFRNNNRLK